MRKAAAFLATLVLVMLCALGGCSAVSGQKPYKDLTAAEISSAKVLLTPPDKTVQIEDTGKLAELLQDVVIYREDDSYTDYTGQGVIFTIEMADGSQARIMAYSPFLVVDGVGYRTEHRPCEALNRYANSLLEQASGTP